ncbi:LON peptidase substrate-binding domain-containing protein [soil metagenome]
MSEEMEKVRGVRELPIFPLQVVLFPGVPLPLHIFEPRYRKMLDDIRVGNNFFGLSYFDASASDTELPRVGHVGCVAEVTEMLSLPDARSNILTMGLIRYRVEDYVQHGDPYLVAKVSFFEDEEESDEQLKKCSQDVAETFTRIARAVRIINDERATLPDISDTEPQRLSFLVAAAIEIDVDLKQELLEVRFTSERLQRLSDMLARAVTNYEERARIHSLAKGNGHGGMKIEIE